MQSLRLIPLRARPLSPPQCTRLCRAFSSQLSLRAQDQSGPAKVETPPASASTNASNSSEAARQPPSAEDSMAARRQRTTDSLTAFINQMMPPDKDSKRPPPRGSSGFDTRESLPDLDFDQDPISRKQGDILRGVTRAEKFAESFSSTRSAGKLPPLAPPVRLDAYISRAEAVEGGVTLARALDKLNIKLAVNQVRWDIQRQKFHERGGLKRKRLRRERWRKRFKQGFLATVKKVQRMKAQGW